MKYKTAYVPPDTLRINGGTQPRIILKKDTILDIAYMRKRAAKEKQLAAIHEVSHAAVIRIFGGVAFVKIWRNMSGNPEETAWLGQCQMYGEPGKVLMSDETKAVLKILPAPDNWKVLVGMAGFIGECIFNGCIDANEIAGALQDTIIDDDISETDLQLIGEDWSFADVAQVVVMLTDMKAEIDAEMEFLMMD